MLATAVMPERSLQQRREALIRANVIRSYRAKLKRDVTAGRVSFADLVLAVTVDDRLATMKVLDLLLAVPKVGRVKADMAFRRAEVSPSKTLGGLTFRQREELVRIVFGSGRRGTIR